MPDESIFNDADFNRPKPAAADRASDGFYGMLIVSGAIAVLVMLFLAIASIR